MKVMPLGRTAPAAAHRTKERETVLDPSGADVAMHHDAKNLGMPVDVRLVVDAFAPFASLAAFPLAEPELRILHPRWCCPRASHDHQHERHGARLDPPARHPPQQTRGLPVALL
eukprot:CAMPEP_0115676562 /NCGR_PEP_ID=MMETSP0272-20121206/54758_1 /TAXON_ID=71861 /ORGANISM="Scrippsiella trochoidea, Strain CCMP3099" /LENGTH=113 /DNA_ID=CAMNT_0003115621 /DNA_START=313 /DNA_END=650 /DNA_ORIENTATION=-